MYSKKHAFTLIELLVTSVILVSLATLTASIFSSIGTTQVGRKGAESLAISGRQVQAVLDEAIERADHQIAVGDQPVRIVAVTSPNSAGFASREDVLAIRIPLQNELGIATDTREWRVYCNEESTRRLIVLRFNDQNLNPLSSLAGTCSESGIRTFMQTAINPTKEYLTDAKTVATRLQFKEVVPAVGTPGYRAGYVVPVITHEFQLGSTETGQGVAPLVVSGITVRTSWYNQFLP